MKIFIKDTNTFLLDYFGKKLCHELNKIFKLRSDYRKYLDNILKMNDMIDIRMNNDNDTPFYFGAHYNYDFTITKSIFIKINFKNGIFDVPYTNSVNGNNNEIFFSDC